METRIDELDDGVFRLATTWPGSRRSLNQFLIDADEPLLFHAGTRSMFTHSLAAVARIMPVERLRWLSFSHVEADEMGALDAWLEHLPHLNVAHSTFGCAVSVDDLSRRRPLALEDGGTLELGGRRVRLVCTPNVPHNPEAVMLYEEVTATLLCSDLGSNDDSSTPVVDDLELLVEPATGPFPALCCLTADTPGVLRRLAQLGACTLAVMHGASFRGDTATPLRHFADRCETEMRHLADAGERRFVHGDRGVT